MSRLRKTIFVSFYNKQNTLEFLALKLLPVRISCRKTAVVDFCAPFNQRVTPTMNGAVKRVPVIDRVQFRPLPSVGRGEKRCGAHY
jgi:hypothetical protein